jgi:Ca-activated chloride channel family protein
MRKAAQFGRGSHVHIGDLGEVAEKMAALFSQIAAPVVTNIDIKWPVQVKSYPQRVPDLYQGEPIMVAVSSGKTALVGQIEVGGEMAGQSWSRQLQLGSTSSGAGHPGVASLWARQKITSLLDERVTGKAEEQVRSEVLEVALAHSLLSPYTSFVAVEERISRPGEDKLTKVAVANSRPRGQSPQTYAYPRTATTAPASLFLGSLLLFLALMVVVMRREEVDYVPAVHS